jgi:hypothetical protein
MGCYFLPVEHDHGPQPVSEKVENKRKLFIYVCEVFNKETGDITILKEHSNPGFDENFRET